MINHKMSIVCRSCNFPFKHTEDFNQTTHVAAYEPIVFNDNFSFYFNSLSSIHGFIRVTNCHIMVISTLLDIFSSFVVESVLKLKTHSLQHGYFDTMDCAIIFKMVEGGLFAKETCVIENVLNSEYVLISFYFDPYFTNCMLKCAVVPREYSVKKLLVVTE